MQIIICCATWVHCGRTFMYHWDWSFRIFRQIFKVSPIAMLLSVSVYVCVSVCLSVKIVCISHTSAKITNVQKYKNDICRFWHLPSHSVIAKLYSVTLTYFWRSKNRIWTLPQWWATFHLLHVWVKIWIKTFPKWWTPILV